MSVALVLAKEEKNLSLSRKNYIPRGRTNYFLREEKNYGGKMDLLGKKFLIKKIFREEEKLFPQKKRFLEKEKKLDFPRNKRDFPRKWIYQERKNEFSEEE